MQAARYAVALMLVLIPASNSATAEPRADPVGELRRTSTFDRAERIHVGRSSIGKIACFTEDYDAGDAELYIGINADGAFVRAEFARETPAISLPVPPVRMFAGKDIVTIIDGDEKVTGEYTPLPGPSAHFTGALEYTQIVNTRYGDGFVLVVPSDLRSFLETVARARGEFIVVQSVAFPKRFDAAAIYRFQYSTINALMACAKRRIK